MLLHLKKVAAKDPQTELIPIEIKETVISLRETLAFDYKKYAENTTKDPLKADHFLQLMQDKAFRKGLTQDQFMKYIMSFFNKDSESIIKKIIDTFKK